MLGICRYGVYTNETRKTGLSNLLVKTQFLHKGTHTTIQVVTISERINKDATFFYKPVKSERNSCLTTSSMTIQIGRRKKI